MTRYRSHHEPRWLRDVHVLRSVRRALRATAWASAAVLTACSVEPTRTAHPPVTATADAAEAGFGHEILITPGPPPTDLATPSDVALLERIRLRSLERSEDANGVELDTAQRLRADLWHRLRTGMAIERIEHPRVQQEIDWYVRHPDYIRRVTDRARLYLAHIVHEAEKRELPTELALLPIVESAFQPYARSPVGATGIWQFIATTGQRFGLRRSVWYDARRDVLESTRAAFDYLASLHRQLDSDWLLAVAGYNAGEGNVLRALERNHASGLATDFFSLELPAETQAYVPRLLAIAALVADPERYGLELDPIEQSRYFEVVPVDGPVNLAEAASMAGITLDELMLLNAGFMRHATDPHGPHRLLLPVDSVKTFNAALASNPQRLALESSVHVVAAGETLGGIARRYGTSVSELSASNELSSVMLKVGQRLSVPPGLDALAMASLTREVREGMRRARAGEVRRVYTVRPGDSLWLIARRHDTTVAKLRKWNRMGRRLTLRAGERLVIWTPIGRETTPAAAGAPAGPSPEVELHVVAPGDSLWSIARRYRVSTDDLLRWNNLRRQALLKPGQRIRVNQKSSSPRSTLTSS